MATNAVVRARIDGHIKEEASTVLAAMGLTVSDAFRIMLTCVAHEKALPFEPLIPNETTIAAMREKNGWHRATLDANFHAALSALLADLPLESRHRDHALTGDWKDHRDCNINSEPTPVQGAQKASHCAWQIH
ncbi:MAG: type II toxin-antitoxin system RelB/DinJ family antitoxin [Burkholderiales bacterium]|jgi:DNA-damage-inducible protein J|nr:type II toxin-antitoxin system RelB/DinJ family antitoxin [Burkholderiales bacterium]